MVYKYKRKRIYRNYRRKSYSPAWNPGNQRILRTIHRNAKADVQARYSRLRRGLYQFRLAAQSGIQRAQRPIGIGRSGKYYKKATRIKYNRIRSRNIATRNILRRGMRRRIAVIGRRTRLVQANYRGNIARRAYLNRNPRKQSTYAENLTRRIRYLQNQVPRAQYIKRKYN